MMMTRSLKTHFCSVWLIWYLVFREIRESVGVGRRSNSDLGIFIRLNHTHSNVKRFCFSTDIQHWLFPMSFYIRVICVFECTQAACGFVNDFRNFACTCNCKSEVIPNMVSNFYYTVKSIECNPIYIDYFFVILHLLAFVKSDNYILIAWNKSCFALCMPYSVSYWVVRKLWFLVILGACEYLWSQEIPLLHNK